MPTQFGDDPTRNGQRRNGDGTWTGNLKNENKWVNIIYILLAIFIKKIDMINSSLLIITYIH